jgi:hypothetical protein
VRDNAESFLNAALGLIVSIVAVRVLRAAGAWETLPASWVALIFFWLSWGRSRALRWWFRTRERAS